MTGKVILKLVIIPISKPLRCWVVADRSNSPFGPHEVHAIAVAAPEMSVDRVARDEQHAFDVPDGLYNQAYSWIDWAADMEMMYFIPTAQNDEGNAWWPKRYVSLTEHGANILLRSLRAEGGAR